MKLESGSEAVEKLLEGLIALGWTPPDKKGVEVKVGQVWETSDGIQTNIVKVGGNTAVYWYMLEGSRPDICGGSEVQSHIKKYWTLIEDVEG